jgi:hypothetical protein
MLMFVDRGMVPLVTFSHWSLMSAERVHTPVIALLWNVL